MRRFLTLVFLLCMAVPSGISIIGCVRNPAAKYCSVTSGYGILVTQVYSITLQPQTAGISLAYGQTTQAQSPSAQTCTGSTAEVSSKDYIYASTNNQLVDLSPTGGICAGTWNRNTGGGIADYTYCNPPNPAPSTNGLPYSVSYITATADSVTSNPVAVYIHPPITSVALATISTGSGTTSGKCVSQSGIVQLDAQACYANSSNKQVLLCAPASVTSSANPQLACPLPTINGAQVPLSSIPACESSIGTMNFSVGNPAVATLDSTTNQITAALPGTTAITASIAGSGSSAGYFSTCGPQSIKVSLANGATSGNIAQGVTQNLTTTVVDTNGDTITGLPLTYQSTNPIDVSVASGGAITTSFPGTASINAVCQPSTCNPAPINEIGLNGTGLSISSNPVTVNVPGTASQYAWFASPGQSQYVVPIELLTGTVGSNVRLPYVPNSMKMDRGGNELYFGSAHELMVYNLVANTVAKQDTSAPGVVLAVSPSNNQLLINDQARHVFYLYSATSGGATSFGGMGVSAAWTPDSETLYIYDNSQMNTPSSCAQQLITGHTDALYVYNANTGWSVYSLPASTTLPDDAKPTCGQQPNTAAAVTLASQPNLVAPVPDQTPAITVPGIGAYLPGNATEAHTWCPSGTVGNNATIKFFPEDPKAADITVVANALAATLDGAHILGAASTSGSNTIALSDIGVSIPTTACPGAATSTLAAISTNPTLNGTTPLNVGAGVAVTSVSQVVAGAAPTTSSLGAAPGVAFVTYSASSSVAAQLPFYLPAATGEGVTGSVALNDNNTQLSIKPSAPPTAPLAGVFSPDDTLFFVSTSGDNAIHYVTIPTSPSLANPPKDSQQIFPNLPACTPLSSGGTDPGCVYSGAQSIVPATVIEVKPRSTT
jgi:hypothetical protein